MVEWDSDKGRGFSSIISGLKKHAWSSCKSSLYHFYPNWGNKGLDYGGSFTWPNFK